MISKLYKFSLLISLVGLLACGGNPEQSTTQIDSKEDKDLNRSLIGQWEYESGEVAGYLDGGRLNFTTMKDFEGGGGMFSVEGTYSVKNREIIIQAKVLTGEDTLGREFTEKLSIVKIGDKLSLKNSKGNLLVYNLTRAYRD
jgi:hypothetical protein